MSLTFAFYALIARPYKPIDYSYMDVFTPHFLGVLGAIDKQFMFVQILQTAVVRYVIFTLYRFFHKFLDYDCQLHLGGCILSSLLVIFYLLWGLLSISLRHRSVRNAY